MTDIPPSPPTSPPLAQSPPPPPASGEQPAPVAPAKHDRLPLVLVGLAVVALVAAVVVFFVVRSSENEETDGPGGTTPITEPFQETSGPIDEDDAALMLSVFLKEGQALRVRIEPSEVLDTEPFLVFSPEVAEGIAERLGSVMLEAGVVDQPAEALELMGRVHEDLDSTTLRRELAGSYTIALFDPGMEGMPDADYFLAFAPGVYTVVAQAYSGSGTARLIVEVWGETVDFEGNLESIFDNSDAHFADIPWFNEARFYEDEERYVP